MSYIITAVCASRCICRSVPYVCVCVGRGGSSRGCNLQASSHLSSCIYCTVNRRMYCTVKYMAACGHGRSSNTAVSTRRGIICVL